MNDTQLYLSIGIPTVTVILAWLSNKSDISSLRSEIKSVERSLREEMAKLAESLRNEMNALRREIHSDMVPLHERVAVVEAKQATK